MKFLNKTLVQYKNSRNSIESRIHFVTHVLSSVNDRSLIIINNCHDIKQSARIIISNRQSRFWNYQSHRFFLQFFMSWSDDESIRNFLKFNFLKVCWAIYLNRSALCDRMRISTLNSLNDRNVAKSEININDLNVLLKVTEVFDVTF